MLTPAELLDVPVATPEGRNVTVYEILNYAADQFVSGRRAWHRAGDTHLPCANCLMLSITEAARELGCFYRAFDAINAVQRYLGEPLGDYNDTAGRSLQDIVDALRGTALIYG